MKNVARDLTTQDKKRTRKSNWLSIILLVAIVAGLAGCQQIMLIIAVLSPPKDVKAEYVLPEKKKTLILVQGSDLNTDWEVVRSDLAQRVFDILIEKEVVEGDNMIPLYKLDDLRATEIDFTEFSYDEIGSKLGADVIICIKIDQFNMQLGQTKDLIRGHLRTRVSVRSCVEHYQYWPDAGDKLVGPITLKPQHLDSGYYLSDIRKDLVNQMADTIAKLFYDHAPDNKGD